MSRNDNKARDSDELRTKLSQLELNVQGEERVREFLRQEVERAKQAAAQNASDDWAATLAPHISLISADASAPHPRVTFALAVQPGHCNRMNNLHGGCAATLFDYCTTLVLVLVSTSEFWRFPGVSRTLNVTYLRPMPVGETFHIECELVHAGKRLATLRGVAKRPSDGAVMAVCEHGKVNIDNAIGKI